MAGSRKEDFASALRADIVSVLVRETGAQEQYVFNVAAQIVAAVSHRYSGQSVYFSEVRYNPEQVLRDFNGRNHSEVCRRHRISRATLYRVLNRRCGKNPGTAQHEPPSSTSPRESAPRFPRASGRR